MSFTCPECQTQQRGGSPGTVVACTACRNPIVVPAGPPPATLPPTPTTGGPTSRAPTSPGPTFRGPTPRPGPGGPRSLWGTAALVLVIVAAAHAGLYLLLTHEARSAVRGLESHHGVEALRTAKRPEEAPQPGTPAYGPWRLAVERFDAAQAYGRHRRHIALLRTGFLASFLAQVAITLWILMRVLGKQKRRRAAGVSSLTKH